MYEGGSGMQSSISNLAPQTSQLVKDYQAQLAEMADDKGRIAGYDMLTQSFANSLAGIVSDLEERVIALENRND